MKVKKKRNQIYERKVNLKKGKRSYYYVSVGVDISTRTRLKLSTAQNTDVKSKLFIEGLIAMMSPFFVQFLFKHNLYHTTFRSYSKKRGA